MPLSNLDSASLISMYRRMRLIRRFEERTAELIDAGEIRAHAHLYIGEEAVAVGVSAALETRDVMTSTHRGHGHYNHDADKGDYLHVVSSSFR